MTEKLGVIVLAGPDNGGTYQYTLSMLQGLKHTKGFEITVYGNPQDKKLSELGYPIVRFAESHTQQLAALVAHRLNIRLPDPFQAEDILLAPIYSLALLHTSKPFAYTLHDLQENYYPENFSLWQRIWRHQVHAGLLGRTRRVVCEFELCKIGHRPLLRYCGRTYHSDAGSAAAGVSGRVKSGEATGGPEPTTTA